MNILFIIASIIFLFVVFGLPLWNLSRLCGKQHWLYTLVLPSLLLGSFWLAGIFESPEYVSWFKVFRPLSFYVLIIGMMLFGVSVLVMLLSLLFKFKKKITATLILSLTLIYALTAVINGQNIKVKELNLQSPKIQESYDFVHITDVHVGSTDKAFVDRIVEKIKEINPQFVVITGDFIDEFYASSDDVVSFNTLEMPVYLITGNHEYYLEDGSINRVIEGSGIELIDRTKVSFNELDIIGVNELESISGTLDILGGVDEDRYTILLDHQPLEDEAKVASQNNIDLMLSGHTHKGQIWPMQYPLSLRYRYVGGRYDILDMKLYVNQGTGTLGPQLRVGTFNEITHIRLVPNEEL